MTTPEYPELVAAVRREGEGILAAASMGLDAAVPCCDGWDVAALVDHVSRVYANVAVLVAGRATGPNQLRLEPGEGDPLDVFSGLLDSVVSALSEAGPDAPVWNWAPDQPDTAAFWARRMAHESSVHRFDAQEAHSMRAPLDAELAGDGLDELLDVLAPRIYARDDVTGPSGTVALQASDNGAWYIELEPRAPRRLDVLTTPDVTVSGTTSALLLACCGRVKWQTLELEGDAGLLEAWTSAMRF